MDPSSLSDSQHAAESQPAREEVGDAAALGRPPFQPGARLLGPHVLALQESAGNGVATRLLARGTVGEPLAPIASAPTTRRLARFEPGEHKKLGDDATTLEIDLGGGEKLTYGDIVALGDYVGSAAQVKQLAQTEDGKQELRWTLWFATLRGGAEPALDEARKKTIKDRYYKLAAENISHFSKGGTAMEAYERNHEQALRGAFTAGVTGSAGDWADALMDEAFGNHFLTDMFSAGHVRTPRQEIRAWYQDQFPDSVERFAKYASAKILDNLDLGWIPGSEWVTSRAILAIGGAATASFSLGDLVSLAFHDQDNQGLDVVSDVDETGQEVAGGFKWRAIGDRYLDHPEEGMAPFADMTRKMASAAVKTSLEELGKIREAGRKATDGPKKDADALVALGESAIEALRPFKARKFVPREAEGNEELEWKWGALHPKIRASLDQAVSEKIVPELRAKAPADFEIVVLDVGPPAVIPINSAFLQFCDDLAAGGTASLEEAMSGKPVMRRGIAKGAQRMAERAKRIAEKSQPGPAPAQP